MNKPIMVVLIYVVTMALSIGLLLSCAIPTSTPVTTTESKPVELVTKEASELVFSLGDFSSGWKLLY